jgi:hypothetical protein
MYQEMMLAPVAAASSVVLRLTLTENGSDAVVLDDITIIDLDACVAASDTPPPTDMVPIPANGTVPAYLIDRFEASIDLVSGLGNADQGTAPNFYDGSTDARAFNESGRAPAGSISWYQARAACMNAGKRLCTLLEHERACRGDAATTFPYGDNWNTGYCNDSASGGALSTGYGSCMSSFGVWDLVGNVWEWVDTAQPAGGVQYAGGSINQVRPACNDLTNDSPTSANAAIGFRCCLTP